MTGLLPGTTAARAPHHTETADDEDPWVEVQNRLSDWPVLVCWQPWQLHVSSQRHA
jgi:hypothetical protein